MCLSSLCGYNSAILHIHGVKYMEAISEYGDKLDCGFDDSCYRACGSQMQSSRQDFPEL